MRLRVCDCLVCDPGALAVVCGSDLDEQLTFLGYTVSILICNIVDLDRLSFDKKLTTFSPWRTI